MSNTALSAILPGHLLAGILRAAATCKPQETGGLLLGRRLADTIHISHVIGGGPGAISTTTSFVPDRDWQYDRIDELFQETRGRIEYLGDWHTHPGGNPLPSRTDRALLRSTARNPACRCPMPVMIIVGTDSSTEWVARAHLYVPPSARLRRGRVLPLRLS